MFCNASMLRSLLSLVLCTVSLFLCRFDLFFFLIVCSSVLWVCLVVFLVLFGRGAFSFLLTFCSS